MQTNHLLGSEPTALVEWIIQLRVGVAELFSGHKELESFRHALLVAMGLGQRTHALWVVVQERRVDALGLDEVADQSVHETSARMRRRAIHTVSAAEIH